jgi:hypothetical protein
MTIFWHETGPLLQYSSGTLHIADLNPELHTKWQMSRWEMMRVGMRFILAALRG